MLVDNGFDKTKADELSIRAGELCAKARDDFWEKEENRQGRIKPFVAAAVGPYGCYLGKGMVYKGTYQLTEQQYMDHHRWSIETHMKAQPKPDILGFETCGRIDETKAICKLL